MFNGNWFLVRIAVISFFLLTGILICIFGYVEDGLASPVKSTALTESKGKPTAGSGDTDTVTSTSNINGESSGEPKPKPLHKTLSIFLRNLAPTITHQEVEAVRL
jgi:hypothetical protein